MMIFTNLCIKKGKVTRVSSDSFTRVLAPFAPHLAEEIWSFLGHDSSVSRASWPAYNESFLREETHEYPVMINGKMRFKYAFPLDMPEEEIREKVLAHPSAIKWTGGADPKRFILVPKKIINVVV
jgi:leucyl-tRNA synthetase